MKTLATLGKKNQATLRKVFKQELGLPKNASDKKLMEHLGVSDKKEMYELMAIMFNAKIETDQQAIKEYKKQNKAEMKSLLQAFQDLEQPYNKRYKTIAVESSSAFNKAIKSFDIENTNHLLGDRAFNLVYSFTKPLYQMLREQGKFKVNINATCVYEKGTDDTIIVAFGHQAKTGRVLNRYDVTSYLNYAIAQIKGKIDSFQQNGSGWRFIKVSKLICNIFKFEPIKGGSYIDLPESIKNKKCCINIKNDDERCFQYCINYHFHKHEEHLKKNKERQNKYEQYKSEFGLDKIEYPVTLKDISKIEKMINKPINIFTHSKETEKNKEHLGIQPLRISEMKQEADEIDLLLLTDGVKNHYVYVKDFNVLVTRGKHVEGDVSTKHKRFYCKRCIHGFTTKALLDKHLSDGCLIFEPTKCELPFVKDGEKPVTKFNKYYKQFKAPFAIYADFECLLKTINDDSSRNTKKIQTHEPCGYAYQVVSSYPHLKFPMVLYRGEDAARHFVNAILKTEDMLLEIVKQNKAMIITPDQENDFKQAENCYLCSKPLGDDRVRDHDHITGLYRGPAHNICNINYNNKNIQIPVFFHNLKNYDGHFIIKALNDKGFGNIRVIAQNFEKYISFQVSHLCFKDSFSFLSSSLDTLTRNLAMEGENKFPYTLRGLTDTTQRKLILQKGIYPYEYMNDFKVFEETQLPSKDKFYSNLNECNISDEDYKHAQNVWKTFNIANLGEYHDFYLRGDVSLLTDIMENFRETAMTYYGLDPCHYLSLPNFAWDCMLKMTGVELDQITDINMYQMIEKGLRGGISMITHRHAQANNKYMKKYDDAKPSSFITYLDANNLYGLAMSQYLPKNNLAFIQPHAISKAYQQCIKAPENNPVGWFVECDIEYPQALHDLHNEYPLAPEKMVITEEMLSPYAQSLKREMNLTDVKVEKLVPNLMNKERYVTHYMNLQYYINKGLRVTKVHRMIQFNQSSWLEPYINFNSTKRAKSKNAFEKDFFKLMNNAVFGKTMENVRNRVDIRLINNKSQYLKLTAKPTFESCQVYDENLVAVQLRKTRTILDKPIYVGMSVLDLSKLHMYKFHYDYIKPKYGRKAKLLFTDTDSLTYHISTDDLYRDMYENKSVFDLSNYSKDHFCYDETNKAVIGKFKDESDGIPIVDFKGLRSKMYSIKLDSDKEKATGKGIKKQALKDKIRHTDYERCLFGKDLKDKQQHIQFNLIRSEKHQLYTYSLNKVGLSCYDDKRYLLEDGITSYSYGHYKISN